MALWVAKKLVYKLKICHSEPERVKNPAEKNTNAEILSAGYFANAQYDNNTTTKKKSVILNPKG